VRHAVIDLICYIVKVRLIPDIKKYLANYFRKFLLVTNALYIFLFIIPNLLEIKQL